MLRFYRAMHWLMFVCRIYLWWSRVHRWVTSRKWEKRVGKLPTLNLASVAAINVEMASLWRKDTARSLWDAVGSPWYFEAVRRGLTPSPKHDFDCDSYAAWSARVCTSALYCMSVTWMDGSKPGGHVTAVCRTAVPRALWHVGNGGKHGAFSTLVQVMEDMLAGRRLIGWALFTWDCRYIASGRSHSMPKQPERAI